MGLAADVAGLSGSFAVFVLLQTAVAIVTKMAGALAGALLGGFPLRPALAVGARIVARPNPYIRNEQEADAHARLPGGVHVVATRVPPMLRAYTRRPRRS